MGNANYLKRALRRPRNANMITDTRNDIEIEPVRFIRGIDEHYAGHTNVCAAGFTLQSLPH